MLHFASPDIGLFGRRQLRARAHRVPVIIARAAGLPADPDTELVIDDFGADEVSLGAGCRCCTVRGVLQTALRRLLAERYRRPFNRVLIESRRDIGPILRTFATERGLASDFHVEEHPAISGESFPLVEDAPLDWDAFSRFVATLVSLRGADLLQVKGMLNVKGCRGPVVVQYLQHLAHRPVELQAWPGGDRTSRVAFVTRGIEEGAVRGLFEAVRALARVPDAVQRETVHR